MANPLAMLMLAVLWAVMVLNGPIRRDARYAAQTVDGNAGRERPYASVAVWAGSHLPEGSRIAAVEIGSMGFFLPHHISILDTYGLLRTPADFGKDQLELIKRDRPALLISLIRFPDREYLERELPGAYVWEQFETLNIALRADLYPGLRDRLDELPVIFETLDIQREYPWDSLPGAVK
jgi:hypothetical protein